MEQTNFSYVVMPPLYDLKGSSLRLLARLVFLANDKKAISFKQTYDEMADALDMSRHTVIDAFKTLRNEGLVSSSTRGKTPYGTYERNTITLHTESPKWKTAIQGTLSKTENRYLVDESIQETALQGTLSKCKNRHLVDEPSPKIGTEPNAKIDTHTSTNNYIDNYYIEEDKSFLKDSSFVKYSTSPEQQDTKRMTWEEVKKRFSDKVEEKIREGADTVDLKKWYNIEIKPKMETGKYKEYSNKLYGILNGVMGRHFTEDEIMLNRKMTDEDLNKSLKETLDTCIATLNGGTVLTDERKAVNWLYGKLNKGIEEAKTSTEAKYYANRLIGYALQKRVKIDKTTIQEWCNDKITKKFN